MKKILILVLFSFSNYSWSDEFFPFVDYVCIPEANYLKVRADGFENIGAYTSEDDIVKTIESRSTLNYVSGNKPFDKVCAIDGKSVNVRLNYRKSSRKGQCRLEKRARLNISVDGLPIVENAIFQSSCFSYSVSELDFSNIKNGSFLICGEYKGKDAPRRKDVCSKVKLKRFYNGKKFNVEENFKRAFLRSN